MWFIFDRRIKHLIEVFYEEPLETVRIRIIEDLWMCEELNLISLNDYWNCLAWIQFMGSDLTWEERQ